MQHEYNREDVNPNTNHHRLNGSDINSGVFSMSIYQIDVNRYNEIMALNGRFDEAERCLHLAQCRLAECEEIVTQAYKEVEDIREVLFDEPIANNYEETEMQNLVRTSGMSAEELNRIVGGV